jgi:uncharacterized protein YrzB (UPF0473 family)
MYEEELLTLFDEEGNEVLYRKVLEFYHPEFKKEYVILSYHLHLIEHLLQLR